MLDPQVSAVVASVSGLVTLGSKLLERFPAGPQVMVDPVRAAVRSAVVAAIVTSAILWGAHELLGGRAATERDQRMGARIDKLEEQQTEIRIQLASIARAVGAEPTK